MPPALPNKKTHRHANVADLGLSAFRWSAEISREDAELVASLAENHPRQFWMAASAILKNRLSDNVGPILASFEKRPVLIRAALLLLAHRQARPDDSRCQAALAIAGRALALPGMRPSFYQARLDNLRPLFQGVAASDIFELIAAPALAGCARGALCAAQAMPDARSPTPGEIRRFTHGQTSFAAHSHLPRENAALFIARIHAQANGMPAASSLGSSPRFANAFFLIAHWHRECLASGHSDAAIWRDAGIILIERLPALAESSIALPLILGIDAFREAFLATLDLPPPSAAQASCRAPMPLTDSCIFEALSMASDAGAAEIMDFVKTRPNGRHKARLAPSPESSSESSFVGGIPIWAVALLAGKSPAPSWMPEPGSAEALAAVRFPKAWALKSKDGSLEGVDLMRHFGRDELPSGARFDAATLCKALGRSWEGLAKPRRSQPKASKS